MELLPLAMAFLRDINYRVAEQIERGYDINRQNICENRSGDRATGLDLLVDKMLEDSLSALKPGGGMLVISEESGVRAYGRGVPEFFMVVDPVDGSNNLRPHPTPEPRLAVSLGIGRLAELERLGDDRAIEVSVHGDLYGGNVYWALNGQGAYFQRGQHPVKIKPSPVTELKSRVLLGMDLDDTPFLPPGYLAVLDNRVIQRRLGSTILDLCQVASGQYDGYLSLSGRLKITDVAQSSHLVRNAGGVVDLLAIEEGRFSPGGFKFYLWQVAQDEGLLKRLRFQMLAAGNPCLASRIKGLVQWTG